RPLPQLGGGELRKGSRQRRDAHEVGEEIAGVLVELLELVEPGADDARDVLRGRAFRQIEIATEEIEDRPVWNRRAVRRARRLELETANVFEPLPELVEQARLAGPGLAGNDGRRAVPPDRPLEDVLERAQLTAAPD